MLLIQAVLHLTNLKIKLMITPMFCHMPEHQMIINNSKHHKQSWNQHVPSAGKIPA